MLIVSFFFFNDTATTEIYTLSLHDALPICVRGRRHLCNARDQPQAELPRRLVSPRPRRGDTSAGAGQRPSAAGKVDDRQRWIGVGFRFAIWHATDPVQGLAA